jgi:hypothetical protein
MCKEHPIFSHILIDLNLNPSQPIAIYYDNRGTVDWSCPFSTKDMGHLNIWENAVREAQRVKEVSISHISGM